MPDKSLYGILGIPRDASQADIRKAYKKMALMTHPDRLPQGASPEDKAASEELFRQVNNAYEVLNDNQNRRIYDKHGVWPPPDEDELPPRPSYRHAPYDRHHFHNMPQAPFFPDPFFTPLGQFSRSTPHRPPHFHDFTDPYTLFNSIFGDVFDPRSRSTSHPFPSGNLFDTLLDPTGSSSPSLGVRHGRGVNSGTLSYESSSFSSGGRGRWTSQSRSTRTVNGVSESEWRRTDSDGNEYVTFTFPDGREKYTINGREQPLVGQSRDHDREEAYPPPSRRYRGIGDVPLSLAPLSRSGGRRHHSHFQTANYPSGQYEASHDLEPPVIPEYDPHQRREKKRRWWPGGGRY